MTRKGFPISLTPEASLFYFVPQEMRARQVVLRAIAQDMASTFPFCDFLFQLRELFL